MAYLIEVEDYEEAVQQFRVRIADILPKFKNDFFRHDLSLVKFLLARDWDLGKAEEMLRKHIEFRGKYSVDQLMDKRFPKRIQDGAPIVVTGRSKMGYPVLWHPVSRWQILKTVKMGWSDDMRQIIRQYCEGCLEMCRYLSEKEGRYIGQYIPIMDMEGFEYSQCMSIEVVRMFRDAVQEYFDQYPEMPCLIRVINAPRIFKVVWSIVEPLLSGRSLSKIEIYGTNKDEWKGKLLELIDPDNLPSALGGSNTTWVDYRSDACNEDNLFPAFENLPDESFEEVTVAAGQKYVAEVNVDAACSLVWNFKSLDYDIGFEAKFQDGQIVSRYARVDSHKLVQKGFVQCATAGKYTLTFDNSYSKFKSKTVQLAIKAEK